MFGKRGDASSVSGNSEIERLSKKIEALQEKILLSEKVQQKVFEVMGELDERIKAIVEEKLKDFSPDKKLDEKFGEVKKELKDILKQAEDISEKTKEITLKADSKSETELRTKLNTTLNEFNKKLESHAKEIKELKEYLKAIAYSKKHGTIKLEPPIDNLKSFKLTINEKLKDLANELDYISSEIASHEYVALLETEFRNKLRKRQNQINAYEAYSYLDKNKLEELAKGLLMQQEVIDKLQRGLAELKHNSKANPKLLKRIELLDTRLNAVTESLVGFKSELKHIGKRPSLPLHSFENKLNELREAITKIATKEEIYETNLRDVKKKLQELRNNKIDISALNKFRSTIKYFDKKLNELNKRLDTLITNVDRYAKEHITTKNTANEVKELKKQFDELVNNYTIEKARIISQFNGKLGNLKKEFNTFADYSTKQFEAIAKWLKLLEEGLK